MKIESKIALLVIVVAAGFVVYIFISNLDTPKLIGIASWTSSKDYAINIQGFKDGLEKMGYVEGLNVGYLVENADGNATKQSKIIQDFRDKKVDLIYSLTTPGTLIAKQEAQNTPIVFSIVTYPVDAGLIKNWYASEDNLVGTSNHVSIERQFSFYSKITPITKIAFVHREGELNSEIQLAELNEYASKNNLQVVDVAATSLDDLRKKISGIIDQVDATYDACDTLVQNGGEEIVIDVATSHKKPSYSCNAAGAKDGALAADAADLYKLGLSSGQRAAFILQGTRPQSLVSDVEADEYTIINLKTAQVLGLSIPEYLMYQTTEVIR